jgi:aminopeptidase N
MIRLWTLVLVCALAVPAIAQPYRFGCHYFRNPSHHPHRPTDLSERGGIHYTIARSDTFDLLHYDIAIDITDITGHTITAATTITHVSLIGGADLTLDLIDALTVDSVTSSDGLLPFTHTNDLVVVDLPPTNTGDTGEVTVHYHGEPGVDPEWGGFHFQSFTVYNLGIGLSTIPPNFGKVWYPCFDSFVERASYTYHVKSSGTYRAHCQGDFLGETQLGGDTVIRTFELQQEITTHISAIAAANYVDSDYVHTGAYGDIPVRLTAKPNAIGNMAAKMVSLGDAIDAYEFWYGPYPYDRVGYVLTTEGALEIAENIAYPDFMPSQPLFDNRGLFGHELGHHWWGDHVTPRTHNDMWLKEGPAEYSAHLLEEWAFGPDAFVNVVKDNMLDVLEHAHIADGGFLALSPMPDDQIYGNHTYYKGAAVMHNLRGYLGDTLFRQAMRTVQLEHGNNNLDAAGFLGALESATGVQLDDFFNAQVYSPGFSVFTTQSFSSVPDQGGYLVDLVLRQRLRATSSMHLSVPLDVTLIGANGQRQEYLVTASGATTELQLTCAFEPVMVVLNGHNRLNQARMDHEFTAIPGQSFSPTLPRVAFRLTQDELTDTTLIRVEHIWAGAGEDPMDWGIYAVSNTHYWTVDGLWPEGTRLNGRVTYEANENELDFDLYGDSEADAVLVYRPNAETPWSLAPDVTSTLGNLTDGNGFMRIDTLRRGQYAFANGNVVIGVQEPAGEGAPLIVSPNPASDQLMVRGTIEGSATLLFEIFTTDGKLAQRSTGSMSGSFAKRIDVQDMSSGTYVLKVRDANGKTIGTARFAIER